MTSRLVFAVALMVTGQGSAQPNVDWKYFGGSAHRDQLLLFYDARSVERRADGHMLIWTKGLPEKATTRLLKKKLTKPLGDRVEKKVVSGYQLPYAAYSKVSFDQYLAFVAFEEIADAGEIRPFMRVLYEVDCADRMFREMSISIDMKGQSGSSHEPRQWQHIGPETNMTALAKLVCPST